MLDSVITFNLTKYLEKILGKEIIAQKFPKGLSYAEVSIPGDELIEVNIDNIY